MSSFTRIRRAGFVNCYLVEENDGLTAIDTNLGGSAKRIVRAAGVIGKPITRIILTHGHADHVGSLDALAEAVPDAEIFITARDARFVAGDKSLDDDEQPQKLAGSWKQCDAKPDRLVNDGELIGSLQVVFAPGHTPGHIALLDTRDKTLFCGDVYSTWGGLATSSLLNPLFPLVAPGTWNKQVNLDSARKLVALEPARLAPGHGRVIENPVNDMELVIEKAARKIEGHGSPAERTARAQNDAPAPAEEAAEQTATETQKS
ncbi:MAG: MBL fold metallo-hydrolase [Solirubrobacterales bacterium]